MTTSSSGMRDAERSWRAHFPHCITDKGSPLLQRHTVQGICLQVCCRFKVDRAARQIRHPATRVFRSLRIIYCWEAINTMLYCSSPGVAVSLSVSAPSVGIIQVLGSVLAGFQRTLIVFIHLQRLSSLFIHSFHSLLLSHRVCSVVWGSCSGATL